MTDHAIDDVYELSPLQQGILFHCLAAPTSDLYLITLDYTLEGPLDEAALARAWQRLAELNGVLRSSLNWQVADKPLQIVHRAVAIDVPREDWRERSDHERAAALAVVAAGQRTSLSLDATPLWRVALIRIAVAQWHLVWTFHHIILEGWSAALLLKQLAALYRLECGRHAPVPALLPYRDYIVWTQQQDAAAAEAYWRRTLEGFAGTARLEGTAAPGAGDGVRLGRYRATLTRTLASRLKQTAREQRITVNTLLQAAWALVLGRSTGSDDVVFGTVVSGREVDLPGVESVVGLCVNTLPMRVRLPGTEKVGEWLRALQAAQVEMRRYEWSSLVQVQTWSDLPRGVRLFETIFAYENWAGDAASASLDDVSMTASPSLEGGTGYPLAVAIVPGAEPVVNFEFDSARFDVAVAERLGRRFVTVLEALCRDANRRLEDVSALDAAERAMVIDTWNATASDYPRHAGLHELFAAVAAERPDDIAVEFADATLTYGTLDRRSNQLARHLQTRGVGPDTLVGLCLERSAAMIVGMLGIIKAGGAYVPLEPDYPLHRLAVIADDAALAVVVCQADNAETLPARAGRTFVRLDTEWKTIAAQSDAPVSTTTGPDHLAYVIYTSGSTGQPKGALIPQRGVVRLVKHTNYVAIMPSDRMAQVSNSAFDAATFEIWGALLNGARLVGMARDVVLEPNAFARELHDRGITTAFTTTSLFDVMSHEAPRAFAGMRQLLFGGEAADPAAARRVLQLGLPGRLLNCYGPTECTTFAAWFDIAHVEEDATTVPIGSGIAQTRLYVLDTGLEPVPAGAVGELFIGGDGLARGYLNRPDSTADRFVPDPFAGVGGARMYRTGDLAKWRYDGQIVFLGRLDGQVKVRGFRIELGEIEAVLTSHPGVKQVVVGTFGAGSERRLAAWVVAHEPGALDADTLRALIRQRLPDYMVPSAFVWLDAMPLNANSKLDRRRLPAPIAERQVSGAFVAPRSEIEQVLARIWGDALGLEQVGIGDNFFDLGAHSLLVVQVHGQIVQQLGRSLPIVDLFEYPTIESLAGRLAGDAPAAPAVRAVDRASESSDQARNDIAVIAVAGRFPGAPDIEAFWDNLRRGVESIRVLSDAELRSAGVDERLLQDPRYVKSRGVLDGVELFDAPFFGYSPREAELIDPQQRVFLECAHDALERAGHDPDTFSGRIGVYAGSSANSYVLNIAAHPELAGAMGSLQTLIGSGPDFLPTRVSYKLNLRGPSVNVQTACSTSLVAVHEACRSLIDGECDLALAGGVSVGAPVLRGYLSLEGGISSPDGHCRAFDAAARGTVPGHGVGIVVLRRAADAIKDGDTVLAIIRGTAINNDGSAKVGYTAPSVEGQAEVIALAHAAAGVEAASISYIEAHGTGTSLGDPIEIAALTRVFGARRGEPTCAIGSLKSNLGHLDAAAGVANLIKAVLAVSHRELPPSLHFVTANPEIGLDRTPFTINARLTPWQSAGPLRAGVSSFGIGGTNAHAVVEEPPASQPSGPAWPLQLLVLSARTASALETAAQRLADYLGTHPETPLADVAFTLQTGRRALPHRRAVVASTVAEARRALTGEADAPAALTGVFEPRDRQCVFMFSGQGAQYAGMARDLYREDPGFCADVDRCCETLTPLLGRDLRGFLDCDAADAVALNETRYAQPALFVIEYALAQLYMRWGIQPAAMIGHSIGEYVAACLAGVFELDDALALVAARGRLMQSRPAGAMLAVTLSEEELRRRLPEHLSIAAVNAPSQSVVAGEIARIDAFAATLAAEGVICQRLQTSHAFHSSMMDAIVDQFRAEVERVPRRPPSIPFISNLTGGWIGADEATSPEYWTRHLRQPVRFTDGIRELAKDAGRVFLEVGPGRTLASFVRQSLAPARRAVFTSLRHPREAGSDLVTLLDTLGRLWIEGLPIRWSGVHAGERRRRVVLPTYPFERQRYWIEPRPTPADSRTQPPQRAGLNDWFYQVAWRQTERPAGTDRSVARGRRWLLFADDAGVAARAEQALQASSPALTVVHAGTEFASRASRRFTIDPGNREHYRRLLEALESSGERPDVIAHFWGVTSDTPSGTAEHRVAEERGFYSLLWLAQALGERQAVPAHIAIVTSDLHDVLGDEPQCPAKALVLGPCRVIPAEYRHLTCRAIDVVADEWTTVGEDAWERLIGDLGSSGGDVVVGYRRGRRYAQVAEPTPFAPVPERVPARVRAEGVYLITGGFGGIGRALATYLADTARARLVLMGRTTLPDRGEWDAHLESSPDDSLSAAIRSVQGLERSGAEVLLHFGDVCNEADVRSAVDKARARWGRLDGVIHSAGVAGGGIVQLKTAVEVARVFAPKVTGVEVLSRAVQALDLDFFVVCSSMASVLGGAGQADYCAANAYLDAFARERRRVTGAFTVAVDWDTWRDVGMAVDTSVPDDLGRRREVLLERGIAPDEGVEAFARILESSRSPQILVSVVPLLPGVDVETGPIASTVAATSQMSRDLAQHARPELATSFALPVDRIERTIAEVWQEMLGIDAIGRHDNFFDLGGHSLLLVQTHARLASALSRELPITDLFQWPTIASLAAHLGGGHAVLDRPAAPAVRTADNAVAIIGMAARLPGADDVETFWTNLCDGIESIERCRDDQLLARGVDERLLRDPRYVKAASGIDDVDCFDAAFFGYSPREAELIDPQHRLFLECAWQALERAGCDPKRYPGLIGVWAGASSNSYVGNILSNPEVLRSAGMFQAAMGSKSDFLTTRVSYKLNLRGPSVNVQTACSTSLVAVHQACRSLVDGECDVALAGGVSISLPIKGGYTYQEEGIVSPDGHCRAFDARAQGTVPASGVGIVVLKRLAEAVADGDTIHAIIRGTAINNDGAVKVGYTAPSVEGQAAVIARAQAVAGVAPSDVSYIEAHGTGTALGDPIEVAALIKAFGPTAPGGSCAIGTVKSNFGHLDTAAGVAGLIKTALALEHRALPPSLHFETPNPKIDFASSPFVVNATLRAWTSDGRRRLAGVSSFGIGGTNAHAVLEEPPDVAPSGSSREWQVLTLSARTQRALEASTGRLAEFLAGHEEVSLADVAHTLQNGRSALEYRRVVICRDRSEAIDALRGGPGTRAFTGLARDTDPGCVFLFSGQGAQYAGMARELYQAEPIFRAEVEECCEVLAASGGPDLRTVLFGDGGDAATLGQTSVTQPALFVIEYALARLWRAWGIEPVAMIGHSVGEYVAACLAGVFTRDDALRLVATRGRLLQALAPGAMLAVGLPEATVRAELESTLSIAAVNAPQLCVVSGPSDAIAALESRWTSRGVLVRRLETSHAFHSAMMAPALAAYHAAVAQVPKQAPTRRFVSNVTGTWITAAEATSADYWVRHLREAVQFAAAVATVAGEGPRIYLEVGPGRTLASLVRQQGLSAIGADSVLTSVRSREEATSDQAHLLATLGRLWTAGVDVDWAALGAGETRRRVVLPTYPFERQRYWIDAASGPRATVAGPRSLTKSADLASWLYAPVWLRSETPPSARALDRREPWLVFADDSGLGESLVTRLTRDGFAVTTVRPGRRFAAIDETSVMLDPTVPSHYAELVHHLRDRGRMPRRIAHLWSVRAGPAGGAAYPDDFALAQEAGFYSVLSLAQALVSQGVATVDLTVVGDRFHLVEPGDDVSAAASPVLGLCLVLPQEHPGIRTATIDVGPLDIAAVDAMAARLHRELLADADGTPLAWRGGERWQQSMRPLPPASDAASTRLRHNGTYLITGGLGNVGLAIAGRLARDVSARLVLVGRTPMPPRHEWDDRANGADPVARRIAAVRALEAAGAEVLLASADVTSSAAMRAVVAQAIERFGALHGVIHAAGAATGDDVAPLTALDRDGCERQFAAKVRGLFVLELALAGVAVDFCLLTSSLSSILGGLGFGAYAAANRFMDAWCDQRRESGRWISVAFDGWTFSERRGQSAIADLAMTAAEGAEIVMRILAAPAPPRVIVSTADLDLRLDRYVRRTAQSLPAAATPAAASLTRYARPELKTDYGVPVGKLEQAVTEIWQELLGIAQIGRDDNFFDLGGHSLLLVQVHARLGDVLGRTLPVTDLFEFPTVAALARHLDGAVDTDPSANLVTASGSRPTADNAIAIVGLAGRFPGAPDVERFWDNLRAGREAVQRLDDDTLRQRGVPDQWLQHPRYVKAASTIDGADLFDAAFFGYAPREAELIDPQHRVFLECAWEALERAGYDPKRYPGAIGVYAGATMNGYLAQVLANPEVVQSAGRLQAGIGGTTDFLPSRVSYKLNLRGPSINIQAACSTSLVAVHQACRSLVDGECDMALAGGVSIGLPLGTGYFYQEAGILSSDGHCRAFDADAQGTVWGSGVGVVVLKRLADAIADADTIHAVIRGTAVNNDGAVKVGYTAPSVEGQASVIARALAVAGVAPSDISFIEAHGTGTTLGDPIEVAALTRVFGHGAPSSCAIGTLKSNVGHLDAAAGVAGLIKTALALEHRELPPSLHFQTPNPKIDFASTPFYVNTELRSWSGDGRRRLAGVSSFGIGGTNAHAVLEEPPAPPPSGPSRAWQLLPLSARSAAALDAMSERLLTHLQSTPSMSLADVAFTLQNGRAGFAHRRALVCADVDDAVRQLANTAQVRGASGIDARDPGCVFLFTGQGAQYSGMARGLYRTEPLFRAEVDACCAVLLAHGGPDLLGALTEDGDDVSVTAALRETAVTQPALFVIEYALAQLWRAWGIEPVAMLGHSVGEYVAACLAGVFTRDEALRLVATRGRLLQSLAPGAMLAVALPETTVRAEIGEIGSEVSIAAVNAPQLCVVSGTIEAIASLETRWTARGVLVRRLETSHAFHSAQMEPALAAFRAAVAEVALRPPTRRFISNVTGTWITAAESTSPDYWVRHLRETVQFAAGVAAVASEGPRVYLEVGPGRTLASLVRQQGLPGIRPETVLTSLRAREEATADQAHLLGTLGRLWVAGVAVDWTALTAAETRRRVVLPTYPFERQRYWIDAPADRVAVVRPAIAAERAAIADWFYVPSWTRRGPLVEAAAGEQRWLVFADEIGVASAVIDRLRQAGHDVIVVRANDTFGEVDRQTFTIDSRSGDDYRTLVAALETSRRVPDAIAHCWSIAPLGAVDTEAALNRGFHSVVSLAQAVGGLNPARAIALHVVTAAVHPVTDDDPVSPAAAAVLGPCRVIPSEYSDLSCRAIDVSLADWNEAPAALADAVYRELVAPHVEPVVAVRGGNRWTPEFERRRLDAGPDLPALSQLRPGGVYMITGGCGGIGLVLAEYLAKTVGARLLLTGRTPMPPRAAWQEHIDRGGNERLAQQLRTLMRLEASGAEVLTVAADVTDLRAMRAAVQTARDRWGRIDGAIHAAGVAGGGIIQLKTRQAAALVLAPKLEGTLTLARALESEALDWLILCSSMTSIVGGGGQVDYCAANACLDAFAYAHTRATSRRTVAINWDAWQLGMVVDATLPDSLARRREATLAHAISSVEGTDAFARILASGIGPQVLVSTRPLADQSAAQTAPRHAAPTGAEPTVAPGRIRYARPALGTAYTAPIDEIERTIGEVWQELLGLEEIGRDDNFFDLGGHSLLLVQMHSRLQEALSRPFPVTALFQSPTIASLATLLGEGEAPILVARASGSADDRRIAVVGMACRFPGSSDVESFWQQVRNGIESIRALTDDELRAAGVQEMRLQDPRYVKAAVVLEDVDQFDAAFFGFTPREADMTDPQHRLFLECAWEALEKSGYDPKRFAGGVGVYAGASANAYLYDVLSHPELAALGTLQAAIGNKSDYLPARVSYKLNLRGPSVNVQTSCSTSLVAVHQACCGLLNGECDLALAGGASINVPVSAGYTYQEGSILSPDGHCRAFDAEARGTVMGNGVGVVALRRLADAEAAGDTILAVIRGTAINNDGSLKVGFTAPSVEGQAEVIALAHAAAGVEPSSISYVEAHGTATPLGDPVEVAALARVFGTGPEKHCALASVKTNLGHLDAAAGIAGLIKTVLSLQHRELVPSLHFAAPNPAIDFDRTPFYVNTALAPWPSRGGPRRAGVSAFGMGGTNAHAVIEEAPAAPTSGPSRAWQLLPLSARSAAALDAAAARLAAYLETTPAPLADVAYTLQLGRVPFAHRRAILCTDSIDAARTLRGTGETRAISGVADGERSCVFMFSGQGTQYTGMAEGLYRTDRDFRGDVDACCETLSRLGVDDLRAVLFAGPEAQGDAASRLKQTSVTQPALFVIEYALARLWMRWGIQPAAMIGHSLGEYVAACLAEVFTLEAALELVVARGRAMQRMPEGAMLAVALPEADLRAELPPELSLAAVNAPALCVASGPVDAIASLEARLDARGAACRRLETSHAFHSAMMDAALDEFRGVVARVPLRPPQRRVVSNGTGGWLTAEEATSPEYWVQHLRRCVRFADGLRTLSELPRPLYLEVGPGRTLATFVRQSDAAIAADAVLTSVRHPQEDRSDLAHVLDTLGRLWTAGVDVDWTMLSSGERRHRVPLPTYPFQRRRHWVDNVVRSEAVRSSRAIARVADPDSWFYAPSWTRAARPTTRGVDETGGAWLVFEDALGVGGHLAEMLRQDGGRVATVRVGRAFASDAHDSYSIEPGEAAHYDRLLDRVGVTRSAPVRIAHLWSVGPTTIATADNAFDRAQELGFYSLLYLTQALVRRGIETAELTVVGDGWAAVEPGDRPQPEKSTVTALCTVIPQEHPGFLAASIDIGECVPHRVAQMAERIAAELRGGADGVPVAYRGPQRWVQRYDTATAATDWDGALRERGVYVITGGFGNIGMAVAEALAAAVSARLVLVGRSVPPDRAQWSQILAATPAGDATVRRIRAVQNLERLGGEVMIAAADTADEDSVRGVFAAAVERFGAVDGVVHTAAAMGVGSSGAIVDLDRAICEMQFRAKVHGLIAIEHAIVELGLDLDFCLLTSSLSSILGGLALAPYAAANRFLDAFAEARAMQRARWISINFDSWTFGDAAQTSSVTSTLAMTAAEGVQALGRILGSPSLNRVAVSTGSLDTRIERYVRLSPVGRAAGTARRSRSEQSQDGADADLRPELETAFAAPRHEIDERVAAVWQQMFGMSRLGIDDDFFALGGHSLLATQVVSRLRGEFQVALALKDLFVAPTIAALSDVILARLIEQDSEGLDEIEQLSVHEVSRELAADPARTKGPVAD